MPPLTPAQITTLFKNMGKLIYTAYLSSTQATTYRQHLLNLNKQFATNCDPNDGGLSYNVLSQYDVPFQTGINAILVQEDSGAGVVQGGIDNYLTQLATLVGAHASDPPATILQALGVNMAGATGYLQPSGGNDQYHSFAAYFGQNYGVALPQNVSGTLLDSWITTTVV